MEFSKLKVLETDIGSPQKLCPNGPLTVPSSCLRWTRQKEHKNLNGFLWSSSIFQEKLPIV